MDITVHPALVVATAIIVGGLLAWFFIVDYRRSMAASARQAAEFRALVTAFEALPKPKGNK